MSTTRCKFISIVQDRHMLSSTFPKGILRHIRIDHACLSICHLIWKSTFLSFKPLYIFTKLDGISEAFISKRTCVVFVSRFEWWCVAKTTVSLLWVWCCDLCLIDDIPVVALSSRRAGPFNPNTISNTFIAAWAMRQTCVKGSCNNC